MRGLMKNRLHTQASGYRVRLGIVAGFLEMLLGAPAAAPQPNRPVQPSQPPAPAGLYRMKKATVMDEHGFARPVPAMTLLIPTDWQFQGGAQWGQFNGCTTSRVQTSFKAGSADGRLGVELYPPYYWQWSDDPGTQRNMQTGNRSEERRVGKECRS